MTLEQSVPHADRLRSPVLRLAGVSKRYGRGPWVLRDVDLALDAGEVVAISAGNGQGKSTLLRIIVGACRPSAGTVGQRPDGTRFVPDRVAVNERMPAISYLTHMGRVQGLSGVAAKRHGGVLLDRLGLGEDHRTPIRKLSKGNAQKVALAQAVLTAPALLVLDEPWSGLDGAAHVELSAIISDVAASGGVVVFTDHREDTTQRNSSVRFHLREGRLARADVRAAVIAAAELTLFTGRDRPPAVAVEWRRTPGVLDVELSQDLDGLTTVRIRVVPEQLDAVLLSALQNSWSVARVERQDGPAC